MAAEKGWRREKGGGGGGRSGRREERTGGVLVTTHKKRGLSTAQVTTFTQRCALTWGGDLGGDTGVDELVAGGNETFQSGVQHVDGLEDDGSVLGICLLPLGLLLANLGDDGIDLLIQRAELLRRISGREVFR